MSDEAPDYRSDIADELVAKMRAAFKPGLEGEEAERAFSDFLIFNGSIHGSRTPGVARRLLAIIRTQDARIRELEAR